MRTAPLHFALLAILPVALYLALFHPATLDPTNVGWLLRGEDNGENALGLHAFLHDARSGWWPATTLLNAPDGVTLLFTDSNPLLALLLKPFAAWLPADLQVVGPWVLLCFALHALFAWLLLREHAPNFAALWCGVALFLLLPTLANRFVHVNLMAHWLILWALWLFLDPRRAGDLRWWAAVLIVAALVHNYLLVMVAAIWASAMLERFAAGDTARRIGLVAGSAGLLAIVAAIAWGHGAGGSFAVTSSYGLYAMPLDALWNPANQSYSAFLPATGQRDGRGFEGFQYLGLGILLLIAAAVAARVAVRREPSELSRLAWLGPALAVLTLLAVSNSVDFAGRSLFDTPTPELLAKPLDMVRASGRLFWPVAYVMLLWAVRLLYRLRPDRALMVLAIALALQLVDMVGMFAAIRKTSAEAGERVTYRRTPSPEWDRAIAAARDVTFAPSDALADLWLFHEIGWRAAKAGRPMRIVYAARTPLATRERIAAEDLDFSRGKLKDDRLYVIMPGLPVPEAARGRVIDVDGFFVIVPRGR